MLAFIGLGNVGDHYKWTKHNAGFWVIDEFARRKKLSFNPGKSEYVFAKHKSKQILSMKPTVCGGALRSPRLQSTALSATRILARRLSSHRRNTRYLP